VADERTATDSSVLPRAGGHLGIGRLDVLGDLLGPMTGLERLADGRSGLLQGDAMLVERLHLLADDGAQPVGLHKGAIGVRGRGEPAGDLDPLGAEGRDHLAQGGVLAPHLGHILAAQFLQPDQAFGRLDLFVLGHRSFSRGTNEVASLATICETLGGADIDTGQTHRDRSRRGFDWIFQLKFAVIIARSLHDRETRNVPRRGEGRALRPGRRKPWITQPTLSTGIRQLEESLGVQLIFRGHRYGGLTPEGQRALVWARSLVSDARTFREEMRAARHGLSGHIRMAVIPTALTWAATLSARFAEVHPNMRFSILSRTSAEILAMMENLDIDAGLSYLDNEPLGRVVTVPIYRNAMCWSAGRQ
jgi:hypothetical protein